MATADLTSRLDTEIDRILESPYPVALQSFEDILKFDGNGTSFDSYAISNPCKIRRLAVEVYDAFQLWPIIDLLTRLSTNTVFRNALLHEAPEILDNLLIKATTTSSPEAACSSLCRVLLSNPLPRNIPLPAPAQQFFVQTVKEAIASPSATTLGQVYDLLSGACQGLPRIISSEDWTTLEEELVHIVRSGRTFQDQSISLICFGIIYALAAPGDDESCAVPKLPKLAKLHRDFQLKVGTACDFFLGKKAVKCLNLTALQVTFHSKPNVGVARSDALRTLDIAQDIFRVVDRDILSQWIKSSEGETNVRRMMGKLVDASLDPEVQLQLCGIIATLSRSFQIPHEVMTKVESVLSRARCTQPTSRRVSTGLGLIYAAFGHRLNGSVVASLFRETLLTALSVGNRSISECTILKWQIQMLTASASQHPVSQNSIFAAFASIKDDITMNDFLTQQLSRNGCRPGERCTTALTEARRELGSTFTLLYLRTMLSAKSDDTAKLESLSLLILDKSLELNAQSFHCTNIHPSTRSRATGHISDAVRTPVIGDNNTSWKEKLCAHAQMEATVRENSLVRLVGDICRDLEQRCLKAEEPFREEKEKAYRLQEEVTDLRKQESELRGQLVERDMLLESLEAAKIGTEDALKTAQQESGALVMRIKALEQNLREIADAAQAELEQFRTDADTKELELRAALATKETIVEEHEVKLKEAKDTIACLHADLDSARSWSSELQQKHQTMMDSLHICQQDLQAEQMSRAKSEATGRNAEEKNQELILELNDTKEEHHAAVSRLNAQQATYQEKLKMLTGQVESLKTDHESAIAQISSKLAEQDATYRSQLNDATLKLDNTKKQLSKMQQKLEQKETAISDHEQKAAELENMLAEREEEISNFQTMRQTLAAAIGTNLPVRNRSRKAVHYNELPEPTQQSPVSRRRSRRPEQLPCQDTHERMDDDADRSFESTSSKNGPTPKRAKPRKPFKVPAIRQPRLSVTAKSARTQDKRLPLLDVSAGRANMSPIKSRQSAKGNDDKQDIWEQGAGQLEDVDDPDFGSEILLSTPFAPKAMVSLDEDEFYDDTTVDE